jgi:N-acetylglucosaminyl-diphospho-decaprenol L-rhamnosyltransferase
VVPRRLQGSGTGDRSNVSLLSARRPAVARRAVVDVDVVVVAHRGRDRVLACLDSLAAAADGAVLSVTVVDNGSNDGTGEAVAARGDDTRVLDMGFDAGSATAANAGMARGRGRYIVILEADTIMSPGSVRTLVEFADRHPEAGVVAPRLLGNVPAPPSDAPDESAMELDWVSGRALLVPRVVHAVTAGFDESYFSSWADRDWCRRIRAAGYSVWCVPSAVAVYHDPPPPTGAERRAMLRTYYAGAYRYWRQHGAPRRWQPWS